MAPLAVVVIVLLGALVLAVLLLAAVYNSLVRLRNAVKEAWAQIDVQLKRRYDLIPNLVETVKGYMVHERQTLEAVTQARAAAAGAGPDVARRAQAEGGLTAALGRLFAVAEAYPDLKANQNFLALQEELTSTENKIGFSRQYYNDSVMHYNNKTQMFPSNVLAGVFGFKPAEFFELPQAEEREAPKVKFSS
jgi:LemA protein